MCQSRSTSSSRGRGSGVGRGERGGEGRGGGSGSARQTSVLHHRRRLTSASVSRNRCRPLRDSFFYRSRLPHQLRRDMLSSAWAVPLHRARKTCRLRDPSPWLPLRAPTAHRQASQWCSSFPCPRYLGPLDQGCGGPSTPTSACPPSLRRPSLRVRRVLRQGKAPPRHRRVLIPLR